MTASAIYLDVAPIPPEIEAKYAGRFLRRPPERREPGVLYIGDYARLSKDRHADELGVFRQLDYLIPMTEELSEYLGCQVMPVVYCDNNVSATSGAKRHDYDRMYADIAARRLDTIASWDTTRLFRDDMDRALFVKLAQAVEMQPIWFHGKSRKDVNDYDGEFELAINGAVAVRHSRELKQKQKVAFKQRAKSGRAFWPRRPFAFERPNRDGTGAVLNEPEAALLKQAYLDVLRGRSVRSIAAEWTAAGIMTPPTGGCACEPAPETMPCTNLYCKKLKRALPNGKPWDGASLRALLLSPRNAGLRYYDGARIAKGDWPEIVNEQIWAGVVAKLTARKRHPNAWVRKWLLSGLAVCGNCDTRMNVNVGGDDGKGYIKPPRYFCPACMKTNRQVTEVERTVIGRLVAFVEDQKLQRSQPEPVDTAPLEARLETLLGDEARTLRMRGVTNEVMQEFLDEIHAEQAEVSRALALAKVEPEENEDMADLIDSIDADEIRLKFNAKPLDRRRALIDRTMAITIHGSACAERHGHPGSSRTFNKDLIVTTRR